MLFAICDSSYDTKYELNVVRVEQAKNNWCWAASSEMLKKHQVTTSKTQWDAVNYVFGTSSNPYPDVGADIYDTEKGLRYIADYSFPTIKGIVPLQLSALRGKIMSGYPVLAGSLVYYISEGYSAHMFVIDGWDDTNQTLRLVDPSPGNTLRVYVDYYDFTQGWASYLDVVILWQEYITVFN